MSVDVAVFVSYLPQVISLISEAAKLVPAAKAAPKYLDLLAVIVGQGARAYDDLKALGELVKAMVQQQREPTQEEWFSLQSRSDIAHTAIQSYDFDAEISIVESSVADVAPETPAEPAI